MRPTLVLALVFALTGCVSAPRGPHATLSPGVAPVAPPVTASGSYLLHSSGTRVAVERVEKGQPLGFSRGADGEVVAVAGETTLPLQPGAHTWERLPTEDGPSWREQMRDRFNNLPWMSPVLLPVMLFIFVPVGVVAGALGHYLG